MKMACSGEMTCPARPKACIISFMETPFTSSMEMK